MNPTALAGGVLTLALLGGCAGPSREQAPAPAPTQPPAALAPKAPATQDRLVSSGLIIEIFRHNFGKSGLANVPAEVIETGIFRRVPYLSYRASQFELNIYGDPQHPAGVELGVYQGKDRSKEEIRELMALLLQHAADRELVHALPLDEQQLRREGLTFEVTPPMAKDSFGGWWISIYDASAIEKARASDAELTAITVEAPADQPAVETKRPARLAQQAASSRRVYVQNYARANGAYVRLGQ